MTAIRRLASHHSRHTSSTEDATVEPLQSQSPRTRPSVLFHRLPVTPALNKLNCTICNVTVSLHAVGRRV